MIVNRRIFLDSDEADISQQPDFTKMEDEDYLYTYDLTPLDDGDNSSNSSLDFTPFRSESRGIEVFGDQIGLVRNSFAEPSNNLMMQGPQST